VLVTDKILDELEALSPLAPLHQPHNIAPIRIVRAMTPGMPQVACFDTAFHRRHPEVADRYAIADRWYAAGVRRYGFHGLSYEYVADRLRALDPALAEGRTVVCHLGSGASMCAIHGGRSMDSTMGFTAVDGLPMGTRTGQLDPGVVLYLIQNQGFAPTDVERFLYHEGGLKGLSGVSNDMRDLEASDASGARLAIDYFVYRVVRETGALAAAMGGIDGLVFTAGIGEHSASVRAAVVARLGWLGAELDQAANAAGGPKISTPASKLRVLVIPTDEELMIARHTLRAVMDQD
jgi:acetate kinase